MLNETAHARAPKQGRSRQSFDRIIEATIALLRERAYDQITLAEICQRAGVSTGALYGRVTGKDELLRAVQERFLERLGQAFTDEAARISKQARGLAQVVPAVVTSLGNLLRDAAPVLRSFMLKGPTDPTIATAGKRAAQDNHAKFIALVRACSDEILHPNVERAMETSMLLIYSTQARFLGLDSTGGVGEGDWDGLLEDLSDMMLAYLRFVPQR